MRSNTLQLGEDLGEEAGLRIDPQHCATEIAILSFILLSKLHSTKDESCFVVKLRQGSGKDRQGKAVKAKGLKALTLA